jgi:hypothetical protein
MALPALNITFTAAQIAAMDAALTALETNCPFRVNIPADDKKDEQAMNVKRYPFVKTVIENYAPANVNMQPPFIPLADGQNDLKLYEQFIPILNRLNGILESFLDTQWLAGTEAYGNYFLEFYSVVERAKNNNVPGADAIWNDLKRLFEGQGPTPPVTPTP